MDKDFSTGGRFPSAHEDDDTLVITESESFAQFEGWIDADLARLVARWSHMAAPNANRPPTVRRIKER